MNGSVTNEIPEVDQAEAMTPSRFRRKRTHRFRSRAPIAINLAPMIDVTFLLLVFFLVTTTFERAEGILRSQLPSGVGAPAPSLPITPIVVRIRSAGASGLGYTVRVDHFDTAPTTFVELANLLRDITRQPGFDVKTPVAVVAENNVLWDHVVGAWNAAVRAGFQHVAFAEP